ncbi:MAG: lysoplasmalogenase family protein [Longibaculum sp.]
MLILGIYVVLFIMMIGTLKKPYYVFFKGLNSLAFVGIAIYGAISANRVDFLYILLPGLIGCMLGDIILATKLKNHFLYGLIAFLIANLCFVLSFYRLQGLRIEEFMIPVIAMIVLVSLSYLPHMNYSQLEKPVMIYCFVIAWAMSKSIMLYLSFQTSLFLWLMIGFILYFISDFILLFYKFYECQYKNQLGFLNLLTYYAGLFMIVYSLMIL